MPGLIGILKRVRALPALLTFAAAFPVHALPQEFAAVYTASAKNMTVGRAELSLQRDGDHYRYSSEMYATGIVGIFYTDRIYETSTGAFGEQGIRPDRYDYHRTGSREREDSVDFAVEGAEAVVRYKGETRESVLPPKALDPLSLHMALMADVASGRERMRYLIAEPRRLRAYELEVSGRESIETPKGEIEAIRVDLIGKADAGPDFALADADIPPLAEGERTSFWFAPSLDYLLVRIRNVDPDDGTAVIELQAVESLERGAITTASNST